MVSIIPSQKPTYAIDVLHYCLFFLVQQIGFCKRHITKRFVIKTDNLLDYDG